MPHQCLSVFAANKIVKLENIDTFDKVAVKEVGKLT
jgi:hypothetical protein